MSGKDCAFPRPDRGFQNNEGLSKREYIAAMCLQGMLAHPELMANIGRRAGGDTDDAMKVASQGAIMHADSLLAELEKEKKVNPRLEKILRKYVDEFEIYNPDKIGTVILKTREEITELNQELEDSLNIAARSFGMIGPYKVKWEKL